jgi:hypothetical protein
MRMSPSASDLAKALRDLWPYAEALDRVLDARKVIYKIFSFMRTHPFLFKLVSVFQGLNLFISNHADMVT